MNKKQIVKNVLRGCSPSSFRECGSAFASSNIALCKYWGKRDEDLNLPVTSSLSISLGEKGAFTHVKFAQDKDCYFLNAVEVAEDSNFAIRLKSFLDLFRHEEGIYYRVDTYVNIPVASGIASSACGFAALVEAINRLYNWNLDTRKLSILARLGSGSAARSIEDGFVEWHAGITRDGSDSFAEQLPYIWEDLRVGILIVSSEAKRMSSRDAMRHTMMTSPMYSGWQKETIRALKELKYSIAMKNFRVFGEALESNSVFMHEMMFSSVPPIDYDLRKTTFEMTKVHRARAGGLTMFFTQDAGPNLHIFFLSKDEDHVREMFSTIEIIEPFEFRDKERVVLLDENDVGIGVKDKLRAHEAGDLHRGFSVFILRKGINGLEVLLQCRHDDKYHSGGLWSNTCCGHPRAGEDTLFAAKRRLEEEMGFQAELKFVGKVHYKVDVSGGLIENEIDYLFVGFVEEVSPCVHCYEVKDFRWMSFIELEEDMRDNPSKYTPWLKHALERL